MNSVFSVDEIDNSFFIQAEAGESAEVPLGRSQSEWAFHRLLEEVSSSSSATKRLEEVASHVLGDGSPDRSATTAPPIDREECHTFLKSRLDAACAAVTRSRESAVNASDSVCFSESPSQVLVPRYLNSTSDDMNHQYDEASVNATGINPLLLAMSNLSSTVVPFVYSPIDSFPASASAVLPDSNHHHHFFHPGGPNISNGMNSHHPGLGNNFPSNDPTPVAGNIQNGAVGIAGTPGWNSCVP